jgi:hypothetical protein
LSYIPGKNRQNPIDWRSICVFILRIVRVRTQITVIQWKTGQWTFCVCLEGEVRSLQRLGVIPQTEAWLDDLNETQLLVCVPNRLHICRSRCLSETPNHTNPDHENIQRRGKLVRWNYLELFHKQRLVWTTSMRPSSWCVSRTDCRIAGISVRTAEVSIICRRTHHH